MSEATKIVLGTVGISAVVTLVLLVLELPGSHLPV
jgi:hypothetical protein